MHFNMYPFIHTFIKQEFLSRACNPVHMDSLFQWGKEIIDKQIKNMIIGCDKRGTCWDFRKNLFDKVTWAETLRYKKDPSAEHSRLDFLKSKVLRCLRPGFIMRRTCRSPVKMREKLYSIWEVNYSLFISEFVGHDKIIGFYSKYNTKPLKNFKQGSKIMIYAIKSTLARSEQWIVEEVMSRISENR